jgi:hypothetical protein
MASLISESPLGSGPDNLDAFARTQRLPQQRQQGSLSPHLLEQIEVVVLLLAVRAEHDAGGGEVFELPNYISPIAVIFNVEGVDELYDELRRK